MWNGEDNQKGYFYDLLLYNHDASEDMLNNAVIVISKVLVERHDQSGHLCITYSIISKSFTWPRISRDIYHMWRDIKLISLILKRHLLKPH